MNENCGQVAVGVMLKNIVAGETLKAARESAFPNVSAKQSVSLSRVHETLQYNLVYSVE